MITKTLLRLATILLYLVVLSFGSHSQTIANDGVITSWNGNAVVWHSDSVQMVKEIVYIKLFESYCSVRCKFWFYNHGTDDTLIVGFPSDCYSDNTPGNYQIEDFKSLIQGKPVVIDTIRSTKASTKSPGAPETEQDSYINDNYDWFTKRIVFTKQDTIIIEDSYHCLWGGASSTNFIEKTFKYVLGTGATWSNNIQNGTIIIDYSNFGTKALFGNFSFDCPKYDFISTNNYAILSFFDFKPKPDLAIIFNFFDIENAWNYEASANELKNDFKNFINEESLDHSDIIIIKNEILAHYGYQFKDSTIQKYYETMKWYNKTDKSSFSLKNFQNSIYKLINKFCKSIPNEEVELYETLIKEDLKHSKIIEQIHQIDKAYLIESTPME